MWRRRSSISSRASGFIRHIRTWRCGWGVLAMRCSGMTKRGGGLRRRCAGGTGRGKCTTSMATTLCSRSGLRKRCRTLWRRCTGTRGSRWTGWSCRRRSITAWRKRSAAVRRCRCRCLRRRLEGSDAPRAAARGFHRERVAGLDEDCGGGWEHFDVAVGAGEPLTAGCAVGAAVEALRSGGAVFSEE